MKKKIILLSLLIALMMFVLSACSDGHTHTYSDDWSSSSDGHWKDSTCEHEGKSEMSVHSFDDGAISTDKTVIFYTCSVCGYIDQKEHTHSFTDWQTTEAASIFEKGEQTRSCTHVLCGETECRDVPKIEVSSILINTYPEKLVYIENESFKPNGLKVSAIDAEGNHTDITDLVEFDKTTLTGSDTQVTVSYSGKTATIEITVYTVNNHTHAYPDRWSVLTPATMLSEGQNCKSCTFPGCNEKQLETTPIVEVDYIVVTSNPNDLEYYVGDRFNPSGIVVWAYGADYSELDVSTLVSFDKDIIAEGDADVTVTFGGKSETIKITVYGINNHTHSFVGDWKTSIPATVLTEGEKYKECFFNGCTERETVSIPKVAINNITIARAPDKTDYIIGELFDPAGLIIMANGEGSSEDITALVSFDKTLLGENDTSVSAIYNSFSVSIEIEVFDHIYEKEWHVATAPTIFSEGQKYKECIGENCDERIFAIIPAIEITSISVTTPPRKTAYVSGEAFNCDGIKVVANGADGCEYDISALVSFDKTTLTSTDTTVTVSYKEKSTSISISVYNIISVSDALLSENYGKEFAVEGIYVGVSDEGSSDDKEMLIKDTETDTLIAVRGVPYGDFPYYGYEYGDYVRIFVKVERINYNSSANSDQNKTYLSFSESNSSDILDTILARGCRISYKLENVTTITSWSQMQNFFKGNLEMYTYVHIKGTMWFNSYSSGDKVLLHRLTMNSAAANITAIKPDGKRAVAIRQNMLEANVPASLSMYFDTAFGVMNSLSTDKNAYKDYPTEGAKSVELDFYAVVTASNDYNYQLTILDPSWLLGRSEEVSNDTTDNHNIVKEVAYSYYRQGNQIFYCDKWRNENISPEQATSQRPVSLDCSSFVNAVYYEAFGENVLGVAITNTEPKTETFNNYGKNNLGKSDVVGYWETANYPDAESREVLLAEIYASLDVGDVIVYRRDTGTGHTLIYIGDGLFLHSTGGINYSSSDKKTPTNAKDKCSTNEYIYGTVLELSYTSLFTNTSSSNYLFYDNRASDGSYVTSFAVLRPLARGLTPTEKTLNRMNIAGVAMEKTVSAGLDKAVQPGSLITYALTLENYSTTSYTGVLFEETLGSNVTFVSGTEGLTVNGNKITMSVDVDAMSTRVITWTVKVDENAKVGDKIVSDKTYFGGIDVFDTTNYISSFTEEELQAIADKAREYADGSTVYSDPTDLANKIYTDAIGASINLDKSEAVMTEIFNKLTVTSTAYIKANHAYKSIMVPTLYSGYEIRPTEVFTSIHRISDFMLGDVILCRWSNNSGVQYRIYIYVGNEQFVKVDTISGKATVVNNGTENFTFLGTDASTRFTCNSITSQLRMYGKCVVLRPTMGYTGETN